MECTQAIVRDIEASEPLFEILIVLRGRLAIIARSGGQVAMLGVFVGVVWNA
jgi:hypothetical protein